MISRLKFEISNLVNQILDQFPPDIWSSTTTTFLDPAIGGGQFVREIERRLAAAGHSDDNIHSRVFGYEEYEHRARYAVNKYKLKGTYATANFLEMEHQMKFDAIVGNPPFQTTTESESKKKWQPIWQKFLARSFDLCKPAGYVAMISPRSWASGSRNPVKSFFRQKRILYVNMNVTCYFNIIGDVSCYVLQNCPTKPELAEIVDVHGEKIQVNVTRMPYLPFNLSRHGLNIFNKTVMKSAHYSFTESKTQIENITPPRIVFLAGRNGDYAKRIFVENTLGISKGIGQVAKITNDEIPYLEETLRLKLYIFLFYLLGGTRGLNRTWILNSLPKLPPNKWTDQELYAHFKLTPEEIEYVERSQ